MIDETFAKNKEDTQKLKNIINALDDMKKIISLMPNETSKVVTQFSDSIVVSFNGDDVKEVTTFLGNINRVVISLFSKGILCRGAIAYGKLFHSSEFVLGPALVEAYQTESEAAVYPRIIFDKSVIDVMKSSYTRGNTNSFRGIRFDSLVGSHSKKDSDDKYFIDYFANAALYLRDQELVEYYNNMRILIINGLKFRSAGLKSKYGWMKNKYNKIADEFKLINDEEDVFIIREDINEIARTFKPL